MEKKTLLLNKTLRVLALFVGLTLVVSISMAYIFWALLLGVLLLEMALTKSWPRWRELPLLAVFASYVLWGLCVSLLGAGIERSLYYWRSDLLCVLFWSLYLIFRRD